VGNSKSVQFVFLPADETEANPAGEKRRKYVLPNQYEGITKETTC